MWRARMETIHFVFEAFGASKGDAMGVLRAGLDQHAEQCGIGKDWWSDHEISFKYITRGECYRDNELLRETQ